MIERTCETCGKKFKVFSCRMKNNDARFCSSKCYQLNRGFCVEKECEVCDKKFMVRNSVLKKGGGKFCSPKCYYSSETTRKERRCRFCGKIFTTNLHRIKIGQGKFCSIQCNNLDKKKHFFGQKSIHSFRVRARKLALKAFEPICVICGEPEDHVHHKNCDPTDNNIRNLEFRCKPCHLDIHREIREEAKSLNYK